jgi:hypothetical protein
MAASAGAAAVAAISLYFATRPLPIGQASGAAPSSPATFSLAFSPSSAAASSAPAPASVVVTTAPVSTVTVSHAPQPHPRPPAPAPSPAAATSSSAPPLIGSTYSNGWLIVDSNPPPAPLPAARPNRKDFGDVTDGVRRTVTDKFTAADKSSEGRYERWFAFKARAHDTVTYTYRTTTHRIGSSGVTNDRLDGIHSPDCEGAEDEGDYMKVPCSLALDGWYEFGVFSWEPDVEFTVTVQDEE